MGRLAMTIALVLLSILALETAISGITRVENSKEVKAIDVVARRISHSPLQVGC
jgi:hypothetical protein